MTGIEDTNDPTMLQRPNVYSSWVASTVEPLAAQNPSYILRRANLPSGECQSITHQRLLQWPRFQGLQLQEPALSMIPVQCTFEKMSGARY